MPVRLKCQDVAFKNSVFWNSCLILSLSRKERLEENCFGFSWTCTVVFRYVMNTRCSGWFESKFKGGNIWFCVFPQPSILSVEEDNCVYKHLYLWRRFLVEVERISKTGPTYSWMCNLGIRQATTIAPHLKGESKWRVLLNLSYLL
jgi:hypothetical protein